MKLFWKLLNPAFDPSADWLKGEPQLVPAFDPSSDWLKRVTQLLTLDLIGLKGEPQRVHKLGHKF